MIDITNIQLTEFFTLDNIIVVATVIGIGFGATRYILRGICKQIDHAITKAVTVISYENEASEISIKYQQQLTNVKIKDLSDKIDNHEKAFTKETGALHECDRNIEKKVGEVHEEIQATNKTFIDFLISKVPNVDGKT